MDQKHNLESTDAEAHWIRNLEHRYNGKPGFNNGRRIFRPHATAEEITMRIRGLGGEEEEEYRPPHGEPYKKKKDLDTYFSTTKSIPRRLVVQATPEVLKDRNSLRYWNQRRISGDVPPVLKLTELCLNPLGIDKSHGKLPQWRRICRGICHVFLATILVISIAWVIELMLLYDLATAPWNDADETTAAKYDDYDNYLWTWPKHAINPLDRRPDTAKSTEAKKQTTTLSPTVPANMRFPRWLVVKDEQTGRLMPKRAEECRDKDTTLLPRYIFMSFSRSSFQMSDPELRIFLRMAGQRMMDKENEGLPAGERRISAFWMDLDCVTAEPAEEKTKDINNICDAVRGAARVYIVLPENTEREMAIWASRVWTLPEALLAADRIRCCYPLEKDLSGQIVFSSYGITLPEMASTYWKTGASMNTEKWAGQNLDTDIDLLVKHFTGNLTLSELQLFSIAVQALARRATSETVKLPNGREISVPVEGYSVPSLAYAAMGLLAYQIVPDPTDDNFQAIARLSLSNDSNELMERLVCLFPKPFDNSKSVGIDAPKAPVAGSVAILRNIADPDQFHTHLWDIKPLCEVVGIGDDPRTPTLILDQCRAIPIRWKSFPRMKYVRNLTGFRASLSQEIVYYGSFFIGLGLTIVGNSIPLVMAFEIGNETRNDGFTLYWYYVGMAIYFGLGWLISLFAPLAVRQLCAAKISGSSCYLVGFEGTLPLDELERIIFGNYRERLAYSPSSTPFFSKYRDHTYREVDGEPNWDEEKRELSPGQRFFTIVDTGNYTVSVIAAEHPPVVALICGREGGMLRTLLCSWRYENNCLYKESVLRMRSSLYESSSPNDWLKLSLASQGEVARLRR